MALPKFDPWNATSQASNRAYRACRAYQGRGLGTIGTLSTHLSAARVQDRNCLVPTGTIRFNEPRDAVEAADDPYAILGDERTYGSWLPILLSLGWTIEELATLSGRCRPRRAVTGGAVVAIRFATAQAIVFDHCSSLWIHHRGAGTLNG